MTGGVTPSLPVRPGLAQTQTDPGPFDENLISKSTAGPGRVHPAGWLSPSLPAYRSQHAAEPSEEGSKQRARR